MRPIAQVAIVLTIAALAAGCGFGKKPVIPTCSAITPTGVGRYLVTPEQAANAATIAAMGRRSGLGSHAVTVALATAFQESHLHNLPYGDRDSLGLFQQRPSQGWGTREQILAPQQSSAAFYARLAKVPHWASRPVTDAAQAVQRSAAPMAYAQWEDPARALARAFTGEVAAGLSCTLTAPQTPLSATTVLAAAASDLGPQALQHPVSTPALDWAEATWLVAHAQDLSVRAVSARGQSWTATSGRWTADQSAIVTGVTFR